MSTIQVNVVTQRGTVQPVIVTVDHDSIPETTVQHMLGWCHLITDCQHPSCVASVKGTPQPNSEDIATWRQEHPDTLFMTGWFARVYPEAHAVEPGDAFRSGHLLAGAWMAVHR